MIFSTLAITAEAQLLVERNTSVRALGMGNAFTAVVYGADALFYNPAGLARNRGLLWTVVGAKAGVSGLEAFADASDLRDDDSFVESLRDLYGENVWAGARARSIFAMPYLAFGGFNDLDASLRVVNPVYSELQVNLINDYGYTLGVGFPVAPFLHLGLAGRRVKRTGADVPFGPSFIGSLDPDQIMDSVRGWGMGYGFDAGANLVLPGPLVTAVGSVVWKNIGETRYRSKTNKAQVLPYDPNELILGMALHIDLPLVTITPSIDFKHLTQTDQQMGKKINFGLEISLPLIDIRGGFHQGYYTAGAGVNLGLVRADAATYGVELGVYPGQLEDRRYVLELAIELGFGSGDGILSSSSSSKSSSFGRSRLKQRR